jgi:hypothetical protein
MNCAILKRKKKDFRRKFASRIESQIKIDQNYELYKCINTLYYDFFYVGWRYRADYVFGSLISMRLTSQEYTNIRFCHF